MRCAWPRGDSVRSRTLVRRRHVVAPRQCRADINQAGSRPRRRPVAGSSRLTFWSFEITKQPGVVCGRRCESHCRESHDGNDTEPNGHGTYPPTRLTPLVALQMTVECDLSYSELVNLVRSASDPVAVSRSCTKRSAARRGPFPPRPQPQRCLSVECRSLACRPLGTTRGNGRFEVSDPCKRYARRGGSSKSRNASCLVFLALRQASIKSSTSTSPLVSGLTNKEQTKLMAPTNVELAWNRPILCRS